MHDELDKLLKSAHVPQRSPGYWENFPRRVTARLSEGVRIEATTSAHSRRLWVWGLACAGAALMVCLSLWTTNRAKTTQLNYTKLYLEIVQMFPNQVRAIVVDGDGVRLELADRANVPPSVPLRVDVCHDRRCQTYITFSGQQIRVGDEPCDVLADGRGHVLVVGGNIAWTSAEPARNADGYHIAAEPLGAS